MSIQNSSNGISVPDILTIVFIVLKLTGTIDWSWWWVLCPLWIPLLVIVLVIILSIYEAVTR